MTIKGYKAMNSDLTCRGYQFKVGESYKTDVLSMCSKGFHFCENAFDVYNYYDKSTSTIICEVEALGEVLKEGDKSVTNHIKIVRQLTEKDLLELWIKRTNSGYGNSGNRNSGDWNSGNRNSGDWNSGDWNSGYGNSGNRNSGDWNSGYGNSGNRNSGDWNSGDGNSGYFNTTVPIYLFNKPSTMVYTKQFEDKIRTLKVKPILEWVPEFMMSSEQKSAFPSHKTTGGFLKKTDRHDWKGLTDQDKDFIRSLPNFDNEIFKQISGGVSLVDETIEVIINGVTKTILKSIAKASGLLGQED